MTKRINYDSQKWAEDVSSRIDQAYSHTVIAARVLRDLAEDLDADGNDAKRGPHAPPIEDVLGLVKVVNQLLAQQGSTWRNNAHHRGAMMQRKSTRAS